MQPGTYVPYEYLPILIIMVVAVLFSLGVILVGSLVRIRRPYKDKLMIYESGNPPVGEPRERFSIKFYIIAMLFVVFDVEAVFLYPWALVYKQIGLYALIEMLLFIALLLVGYVYAWRKEAFKW